MATTLKSYQGQIASIKQGNWNYTFPYNINLFDLAIENSIFKDQKNNSEKTFIISRIGIQTDPGNVVILNNYIAGTSDPALTDVIIEIGKTGIYQANDVKINNIVFQKPEEQENIGVKNTIIDYIIQEV